jgi:hypothetical protein
MPSQEHKVSCVTGDLSARIGTRIETDKATLVHGGRAANIAELREKRGVLVFLTRNSRHSRAHLDNVVHQSKKGSYKAPQKYRERRISSRRHTLAL